MTIKRAFETQIRADWLNSVSKVKSCFQDFLHKTSLTVIHHYVLHIMKIALGFHVSKNGCDLMPI